MNDIIGKKVKWTVEWPSKSVTFYGTIIDKIEANKDPKTTHPEINIPTGATSDETFIIKVHKSVETTTRSENEYKRLSSHKFKIVES